MSKKRLIAVFLTTLLSVGMAYAQQPYGGCWHPQDIKDWTPEKFPDDKFNRSRVPLAKRFKEPVLMKANSNQHYEGQICNATILFPMCSLCPSQGANNFLGYQPTYWQYMDKLVYWAGSASEGIIIPPPAGSIDAAHQSGVKVLGQIFFPPSYYGGQQGWVREMLTPVGGKYVFAIKLYEIAKYLGFDGWFINEETGGGSESEWIDFINEFYRAAEADGNHDMEIQWYNARSFPNINILKTNKNTSQFIEYGATGDYQGYAGQLGCTTEETFSKIYAGVQCAQQGLTGYGYELRQAFPKEGHVGSLDLFCPEEHVWKDNVKNLLNSTTDNQGEKAYAAMKKTFRNEDVMWVNEAGDPSTGGTYQWRGISGGVLERSVISEMPFVTSFCVGDGKHRFVEGEKKGTQDWYHSGVQSIMPTWRWWIENKDYLTVNIDWDDAYNLGSSIKISGILRTGDHLMRLYKTMVKIDNGGKLRLVYKTTTANSVEVKVSTKSDVKDGLRTLQAETTEEKNGWTVANYNLESLNGETIYMIALNLKADSDVENYSLNLGELALLPANYNPTPVQVKNLKTTSTLGETKGDVRLTWDYDYTNDFDHFDIYTVTENGKKTLVGQTRGEAFYIPTFERSGLDRKVDVQVMPIMKDMQQTTPETLALNYPVPTPSKVTFSMSKSYIKVGEKATITAKGTGDPTAWKWILPDGLELAEGSSLTSSTVEVVAKKAGKMNVSIEVTNAIGTSTTTGELIEVFENEDEIKEVKNILLNKRVVDYSGSTNYDETPHKIIDGVTNPYSVSDKWCNISSDNWAVFDAEGSYRIYGFKIFDGNSGPESGVDQIDSYTIELSNDGKNWTPVVHEEGVETVKIKTAYIAPTKARYVRLVPHVNGTLRIWEFQVFGKEDNKITVSVDKKSITIPAGKTENVIVNYNLNGDSRAEDFKCITVPGKHLNIGEITENKDASTFTIPVTADKIIGESQLVVRVNNGGLYKEVTLNITIDAGDQPNVLQGAQAEVRHYDSDYSYEATYKSYQIEGLTDGDTVSNACDEVEEASNHKDDSWAIFTAPTAEGWNLAKVKIYLADNNKTENENGREGIAANEISIRVGDDLSRLETIKTFTSLGEVSELEYILPQFRNAKYLAIVANMNAFFYPILSEVEAYEQYQDAVPQIVPVRIKSGFNQDVIAESKPAADHTTAALDNQGWVFYSSDVQALGAIAGADRMLTTASGIKYQLADYTTSNALVMKKYTERYTLEFEQAENCEELYVLAVSANGQSKVYIKVLDENGDIIAYETVEPNDWYAENPSGNEAKYGLSRIIRSTKDSYVADQIDTNNKFRLFEYKIDVPKEFQVKSVRFDNYSFGTYPTILAISKKGQKAATAITHVKGADSVKLVGIYSIGGVKISSPQKGINILKYSDGTTKKVIIK